MTYDSAIYCLRLGNSVPLALWYHEKALQNPGSERNRNLLKIAWKQIEECLEFLELDRHAQNATEAMADFETFLSDFPCLTNEDTADDDSQESLQLRVDNSPFVAYLSGFISNVAEEVADRDMGVWFSAGVHLGFLQYADIVHVPQIALRHPMIYRLNHPDFALNEKADVLVEFLTRLQDEIQRLPVSSTLQEIVKKGPEDPDNIHSIRKFGWDVQGHIKSTLYQQEEAGDDTTAAERPVGRNHEKPSWWQLDLPPSLLRMAWELSKAPDGLRAGDLKTAMYRNLDETEGENILSSQARESFWSEPSNYKNRHKEKWGEWWEQFIEAPGGFYKLKTGR